MVDEVITKVKLPENPLTGKGVMSVAVKTERGFTLTRDYGFTVEEEDGKVLAFDLLEHPELGTTLLFGNQVFVLKFWDDNALSNGLNIMSLALEKEIERRSRLVDQTPK
jgi:hypothetical protein